MMERLEYIVRFNTPAFLGDAFQRGQWRTPPFKALLRQWWRIVKASEYGYDYKKLREAEGRLFGHAWLKASGKKWAAQARFKMKIDLWKEGDLNQLKPSAKKVRHPEVKFPIDPFLYLGYGPVEYDGRTKGIRLKKPPAIGENSTALWILYWQVLSQGKDNLNRIESAVRLIHLFGTIGGRSRNGWGSLVLESKDGEILLNISEVLNRENGDSRRWLHSFARDWKEALDLDWCHAIGKDGEGLLFWRSENGFSTWQEAMRYLAEVKIALRTQFHFKGAGPHNSMCDRQVLAYPVMKHSLKNWGSQSRSANQLLFKVHKLGEGYVPIVVHLPHGTPKVLKEKLSPGDKGGLRRREERVWKEVHELLDRWMQRLS